MKKPIEGSRGLVAGKTRQGKSYFNKKVLIPAFAKFKPVVVLDRKHEYGGRNSVDHDKSWKVFFSGKEFFQDAMKQGKISGVNVITCNNVTDYNIVLNFCQRLERPLTLIIDEAHDIFLSKEFYPAKAAAVKIARFGAAFGLDYIMITQRSKDVPPDIRTQFDWLISFYQGSKKDVQAIEEMNFDNPESVRNLEKREKILFDYLPEHIKVPEDNFKTIHR